MEGPSVWHWLHLGQSETPSAHYERLEIGRDAERDLITLLLTQFCHNLTRKPNTETVAPKDIDLLNDTTLTLEMTVIP